MLPFIVLAQRVSFVRSTLLCRLHSACARAILFVSCSWCAILLSVSLKCVFLQYFFHSCSLEMFWVVPLRILRDLLFGITPLAFLLRIPRLAKEVDLALLTIILVWAWSMGPRSAPLLWINNNARALLLHAVIKYVEVCGWYGASLRRFVSPSFFFLCKMLAIYFSFFFLRNIAL